MKYLIVSLILLTACSPPPPRPSQSQAFTDCLDQVRRRGDDAWTARCEECARFAEDDNPADACYITPR